jgi:hypothetical protein
VPNKGALSDIWELQLTPYCMQDIFSAEAGLFEVVGHTCIGAAGGGLLKDVRE